MKDALSFLKELRQGISPVSVFLAGDDPFLAETVKQQIIHAWSPVETGAEVVSLVGIEGALKLPNLFGIGSLFSSRKIIILADSTTAKRSKRDPTPLGLMGKKQIAVLLQSIQKIPPETVRLIIHPTPPKKEKRTLDNALGEVLEVVDVTSPKGKQRLQWIKMLASKAGVLLAPDLEDQMSRSTVPLKTLAIDMEKVALATEEGETASVQTWLLLSQAEPEATVWEISDRLGESNPAKALDSLQILEKTGIPIYQIIPILLNWNQQRLQVKAASLSGSKETVAGLHPFVVKKIQQQVSRLPISLIREQQRQLFYLDRCLKQSWENPHVLLEKMMIEFSGGKGK
jgi:DNA polymerase III delta subunit